MKRNQTPEAKIHLTFISHSQLFMPTPNNAHSDTQACVRQAAGFFLSLYYADRQTKQIIMDENMTASIEVIRHVMAPPHHMSGKPSRLTQDSRVTVMMEVSH